MKKRIAALAIGLSALAAMPALAETMRLGDSAAVTGVKDNIVLRAMPDTEADELAQIASEESVTYLSPEKDGFARVEYDGMARLCAGGQSDQPDGALRGVFHNGRGAQQHQPLFEQLH